jgi:hypothetical protein
MDMGVNMQGDMPDDSFSAAKLARLQDEGIIEIAQPGTPEHAAFDREMAAELEVADAEILALEGPDALTSGRLLRQEALKAELDPERYGHAFAGFCARRGWERSDLASYLGVTLDQLAAMALLARADTRRFERYGADPARLADVLAG